MSAGPWIIRGEFADTSAPFNAYTSLDDAFPFVLMDKEYASYSEASLRLTHFVARGWKSFRGGLKLMNENGVVIDEYVPNHSNLGPKTYLVETNIELADIKEFYFHDYNRLKNIDFYFGIRNTAQFSEEQVSTFQYLITVLHCTSMVMKGDDLIRPVHEGNQSSLLDMLMADEDITPEILSNAIRGTAEKNGMEWV